jgi:hypothetical protein
MALHTLYGGAVSLKFDARKHVYTLENERMRDGTALMVAGVTSILKRLSKENLIPWAANMAADYFRDCLVAGYDVNDPQTSVSFTVAEINEIAKDARKAYAKKAKGAANVGKLVHAFAEAVLKGDTAPDRPGQHLTPEDATRYENGVYAFTKWWRDNDIRVIASERVAFSKRWMYAGTCDFVAEVNGRMTIGDFKTSTGLYPEMALQTAAYQIAIEEEDGVAYPDRLLVRFDKMTGQVFTIRLPRNREHEDCFIALREVDEIMKRIERDWRVV